MRKNRGGNIKPLPLYIAKHFVKLLQCVYVGDVCNILLVQFEIELHLALKE